MNRNEYPFFGQVLCEYRDAVQMIDGCLVTAMDISRDIDPHKTETIEAMRLAILQSLDVMDGFLADKPCKES